MRRRVTTHFVSICLLVVWLSTPFLAVAHALVAEHRFCAEHERMEEATEGHAPGVGEKGPERDASARVSADLSGESSSGHEDCAFVDSFTRDDAFTLPSDLLVEPAQATPASLVLVSKTVDSSLLLLLIAPKSSPPFIA